MTAREALRSGSRKLEGAGIDGAVRDARWLLAYALNIHRDQLAGVLDNPLSGEGAAIYEKALAERAARRPVSKIIGQREFYGRVFEVTDNVLDPRPETEGLIAALLAAPKAATVLDLGTGSGALAITAALECEDAVVTATDISDAALDVARRNAGTLGVENRVTFQRSDWLTEVSGQYDVVLCNPPYIADGEAGNLAPDVLNWEPSRALFAGADGLAAFRQIARGLWAILEPGGVAIFEVGDGQTGDVSQLLSKAAAFDVTILNEMSGRPRYVQAKRPKPAEIETE